MTVQFFLFDRNLDILRRRLREVYKGDGGLDRLMKFIPGEFGFIDPVDGSNNPWKGSYNGKDFGRPREADLGYGFPLVFESAAQAREELGAILTSEDPSIRRLISTEISPSLTTSAPRGQHWCSGTGQGVQFGRMRDARRLIEADALATAGPGGCPLDGQGVNVFVVDQGISAAYVNSLGGTYGGGMSFSSGSGSKQHGEGGAPYRPLRRTHGAMMVRTILDLAPRAKIYDLPLIPDRISDVTSFVGHAVWAYFFLKAAFLNRTDLGQWVVVNPWGVVGRFGETVRHNYTGNTGNWLNWIVDTIAQDHDVVFSAGNSGQFCPNLRAPGYDVGAGESIFGANGLEAVNSIGAVRTDGVWVGTSSQGRAHYEISGETNEKPDYAAPSWYADDIDASLRSSGTSAASAVAAGVIASLRQGWTQGTVKPAALKDALRDGARSADQPGWNGRTGMGILNVPGAIGQLP